MESNGLKKVAFLCNPSPQWLDGWPLVLKKIEQSSSFNKEIFQIDRAQDHSIEKHLEQILSGDFDALAVLGGDGSLNRTVQFLFEKNALGRLVLAVAPFGSCNDFSKSLGLKAREIGPVLKALERGRTREIRVARVNRRCFLNNVGFGRREPERKNRGALTALRDMRPVHLRIHGNPETIGDFLMMICANAPYFSDGLHFDRASDPGDDTLDFFFVRAVSKWSLFWRLAAGRRGRALHRPPEDPMVLKISANRLEFESDDPLWIMTDGEIVQDLSAVREARFEIAGRCRFVAP